MAKCYRCGKSGLFKKVNYAGICSDCEIKELKNLNDNHLKEIQKLEKDLARMRSGFEIKELKELNKKYLEEIQNLKENKKVYNVGKPINNELDAAPSTLIPNNQTSLEFSDIRKRPISCDYYFQNVNVCIIKGQEPNFDNLRINDNVTMEIERTNAYDPQAVMLSVDFDKIGYLYRGKIKDMAYDFINRNDSIEAWISDLSDNSIKVNIAFSKLSSFNYEDDDEDEYDDEDYEDIDYDM